MTAITDRIGAEAKQIHLGRMLLVALLSVFWALGWLAGKVFLGVQLFAASIKVGWADARKVNHGPAR